MKTWATILRCVESHGAAVLVSVVATEGSAPRDAGAHLIVTPQGYHGTIGGGALEWRAMANAQAMLNHPSGTRLSTHALGPELGQCCGGRVTLSTRILRQEDIEEIRELVSRETQGPFKILHNGVELSFGQATRQVYLYGAGHVGRALILALATLPFEVIWVDPRPEAFPRAVPENVTLVTDVDLATAPQGSFVYIMSHSHALDLAVTDAALRNPNIAHVGLIGSATKRARFINRLRQAQVPEARLQNLICPIGIAGIKSKLPAMIAAATAAQILVLDEELRSICETGLISDISHQIRKLS